MIGKIQGNIVDVLYAPLSPAEVTLAIILAACSRSILIAIISIIIFSIILELPFFSFFHIFIFTVLGSFILGSLGFITGLWANKFDNMASITNFVRYGFLGMSDGSVNFGIFYLLMLCILTWFVSYILFKKGYKIKF
jgi:ABC-2 type transport system permease protein